jgi:4-hydroxy-tetrahydrodipicolinate reductase
METIDIVLVGLGPLGRKTIRFSQDRPALRVIGAVDLDPDLQGRDLGEAAGVGSLGIPVSASLNECLETVQPKAAVFTTVSDMKRITPQIEGALEHGLPVVSTCEELSYPWDAAPELAERLDRAARAAGVAVLGTGVNPGFLMDSLPAFLTAVCHRVDTVKVQRLQDASFRRVPFQKKIGAGLTIEEFEARKGDGSLRHVGLTESMQMIAAALGWKLDKTEDVIGPVIAEREIKTEIMIIPPGFAAGVEQIGRGWMDGRERVRLIFRAAIGELDSHDTVNIQGEPSIVSTIPGGVNGDTATCAITLNAVHSILTAPPGLRTMVDMPLISCFG